MPLRLRPGLVGRLSFAGRVACRPIKNAAAQAVVRINGSGSLPGLAQAFRQAHPDVKAEVQQALGSAGSISALAAGTVALAVSNRQPKESERAQRALQSNEYARTPVVIAMGGDLGDTALTLTPLAARFAEGAAACLNGKRTRPVLRLSDNTDTELLRSLLARGVPQQVP